MQFVFNAPVCPDGVADLMGIRFERADVKPSLAGAFFADLADRLRRLDKGAPHIVIADDAKLVGDAGGLGVADRGGNA